MNLLMTKENFKGLMCHIPGSYLQAGSTICLPTQLHRTALSYQSGCTPAGLFLTQADI